MAQHPASIREASPELFAGQRPRRDGERPGDRGRREAAIRGIDPKAVAAGIREEFIERWRKRGFAEQVMQSLVAAVASAVHVSLAGDRVILISAETTATKVADRWKLAFALVDEMVDKNWSVMRIKESLAAAMRARLDGHPFDPIQDDKRTTWEPEAMEKFAFKG